MEYALYFAKAIVSGVLAFAGSLATVMVGDVGFGDVTDGQWLMALIAGLGTAAGVAGITNGPKPGTAAPGE